VFPARDGSAPVSPTSLHKPFNAGGRPRGIPNDASIQTLRHASATYWLERGVSRRGMQELLGHQSPRTTARDPHLTPPPLDRVPATSTARMADL
jgi:integrase/recombinase XerD